MEWRTAGSGGELGTAEREKGVKDRWKWEDGKLCCTYGFVSLGLCMVFKSGGWVGG